MDSAYEDFVGDLAYINGRGVLERQKAAGPYRGLRHITAFKRNIFAGTYSCIVYQCVH